MRPCLSLLLSDLSSRADVIFSSISPWETQRSWVSIGRLLGEVHSVFLQQYRLCLLSREPASSLTSRLSKCQYWASSDWPCFRGTRLEQVSQIGHEVWKNTPLSSASPRPRPLGSRAATCLAFSNVYPTAPPVLTEPFKTLTCIQTAQTYRYTSEIALRSALGKHSGETMDSGNSNVFFKLSFYLLQGHGRQVSKLVTQGQK